jgi:hypothetical protein
MLMLTMDPDYILDFFRVHPCDMCDQYADVVRPGTPGNVMSPTPVMDSFFQQLGERDGQLMTQEAFADYHLAREAERQWYATLDAFTQRCYRARLYRQFYLSAIDSLHVWALLGTRYRPNGTLVFDRCIIDTKKDVVLKTDLLVYRAEACLRIALTVDTHNAQRVNTYKRQHRGGPVAGTIELRLRVGRARRSVGNKCWFHWPEDFRPIFHQAEQLWLIPPLEDSHG